MEAGDAQSRCNGVSAQPTQTELIASREQNQGGSGSRDVWEGKCELDSRMDRLTCLGPRGQVSPSNDNKPTRRRVLTMRHISMVASGARRRQQPEQHPHIAAGVGGQPLVS